MTFEQKINELTGGKWGFKNKKVPALLNEIVDEVRYSESYKEWSIIGVHTKGTKTKWVRVSKASEKIAKEIDAEYIVTM